MTIKRPIIGALHSKDYRPKIRYCQRCEDLFQVQARLGPRIMEIGVPKPSDYDLWLECRNLPVVLNPKHEVKVEPELEPIKEPSDGKQAKSQGIEKRRKTKGRGYNPRLKRNKWEIKDSELNAELRSVRDCWLILRLIQRNR